MVMIKYFVFLFFFLSPRLPDQTVGHPFILWKQLKWIWTDESR